MILANLLNLSEKCQMAIEIFKFHQYRSTAIPAKC